MTDPSENESDPDVARPEGGSGQGEGYVPPEGWYPDPSAGENIMRYWDGHAWTEHISEGHTEVSGRSTEKRKATPGVRWSQRFVGALIGIALVLYFTGHLDTLYPLGLNLNECAKNAYGSVYCGSALTEYRQRVEKPAEEAQEKAKEAATEAQEQAKESQQRLREQYPEAFGAEKHGASSTRHHPPRFRPSEANPRSPAP